jgi:hypothetical protein
MRDLDHPVCIRGEREASQKSMPSLLRGKNPGTQAVACASARLSSPSVVGPSEVAVCWLVCLLHAEVVVHPPAEVAVCLAKVTVCSPRLSSARWGCCPPAEVAASHHQWERPCPSPQMVLSALSTAAEMKHCGGNVHLCMQMDCFIGVCYCRIGYVSTVDVKLITICLSKNTFHWS